MRFYSCRVQMLSEILSVLKNAHQSLVHEQGHFAGDFGAHLSPTELTLLYDSINISRFIYVPTILLRKTNTAFIQDVEMLTECCVAKLRKLSG